MASEPGQLDQPDDDRTICEALRRKIREKGLTYEQVEKRAGMGSEYLRQVLRGTVKLRVQHVREVLAALGIPPIEFWVEIYGPPPRYASDEDHASFARTVQVMHRSLMRRMIWKLKEKGVLGSDEASRMLEDLEQTAQLSEPPL